MSNSNNNTPTRTWERLVDVAMGSAAAHRATGGRTAKSRRAGQAAPMEAYVTEETAWDGFADRLVNDPAARAYCRQERPTSRLAGLLTGSATFHQTMAERSPSLAVTGCLGGRKANHVQADDVLPHVPVTWEPLADLEEREELAVILADLPEGTRETAALLMAGEGCPDDVNPGTWRKRVHDARQKIAAAWKHRQEVLDGIA